MAFCVRRLFDVPSATRALSGSNKAHNIAKIKGAKDKRVGALVTKHTAYIRRESRINKNIKTNNKLKSLYDEALVAGVPKDALERAINAWDGAVEAQLGIVGPHDTRFLIDFITSSKGATVNEVGSFVKRVNSRVGPVDHDFRTVYTMLCQLPEGGVDDLEEVALECGTDIYRVDEDNKTVEFDCEDVKEFREGSKECGLKIEHQTVNYLPNEMVSVLPDGYKVIQKIVEYIENNPDTDNWYHNIQNIDEVMSSQ